MQHRNRPQQKYRVDLEWYSIVTLEASSRQEAKEKALKMIQDKIPHIDLRDLLIVCNSKISTEEI